MAAHPLRRSPGDADPASGARARWDGPQGLRLLSAARGRSARPKTCFARYGTSLMCRPLSTESRNILRRSELRRPSLECRPDASSRVRYATWAGEARRWAQGVGRGAGTGAQAPAPWAARQHGGGQQRQQDEGGGADEGDQEEARTGGPGALRSGRTGRETRLQAQRPRPWPSPRAPASVAGAAPATPGCPRRRRRPAWRRRIATGRTAAPTRSPAS